jgi:hypothetical protein
LVAIFWEQSAPGIRENTVFRLKTDEVNDLVRNMMRSFVVYTDHPLMVVYYMNIMLGIVH